MKEDKVSIKTIIREGCKDFARTKRETFSKENCLITDKDKFIYLLILRFRDENKNGESTISRKSIAEFMSSTNKLITVDNVSESISSLRRAKYIEVKEKLFWSEKNQCSINISTVNINKYNQIYKNHLVEYIVSTCNKRYYHLKYFKGKLLNQHLKYIEALYNDRYQYICIDRIIINSKSHFYIFLKSPISYNEYIKG